MTTGGLAGLAGQITLYSGAVLAVSGVSALIWRSGRSLVRTGRRIVHLADDLLGEPAHGDQPERPGLMARVGRIEAEMRPNSGSSLRDAIDGVRQRLEDHIDSHHVV